MDKNLDDKTWDKAIEANQDKEYLYNRCLCRKCGWAGSPDELQCELPYNDIKRLIFPICPNCTYAAAIDFTIV
jgi:hypothetical protein